MIRDDFAGPGGWSEALKALGREELGIEFDKAACETAEAAGHKRVLADVKDMRAMDSTLEGYIASPPCQTFSAAGKGAGRKALDDLRFAAALVAKHNTRPEVAVTRADSEKLDERSVLVLEPLYVISNHRPEWVALEQVPPVLPIWETYAEILITWGYQVKVGLIHAEQYGVPQTRKRAILMASFSGFDWPEPTHSRYYPRNPAKLDDGVKPWVSMAQALGWTEPFVMRSNYGTGGDASKRGERTGDQPAPAVTSKIDRNIITYRNNPMANQAERTFDQPAPTVAFGHERPQWCYRRPSTTIVGSFKPEIVAAPGYRTTVSRQNAEDSVRVTVAEAGILQSFRADYPWRGSKTKQYQQVGNAIPPLLAEAILRELV